MYSFLAFVSLIMLLRIIQILVWSVEILLRFMVKVLRIVGRHPIRRDQRPSDHLEPFLEQILFQRMGSRKDMMKALP